MIIEKLREIGIRSPNKIGEHKTTCPKCSTSRTKKKDPCLSVKIDSEVAVYHCHHCNWSGKVFEKDATDYAQYKPRPALRRPTFTQNAPTSKLVEWFSHRGISEDVVRRAGVCMVETNMPTADGWRKESVVAFPYYRGSEVVNVKYRSVDKRFRQEKDAEKVFFGLDMIGGFEEVYIVEGEIDALSLRECDIPNVLSVPDGAPQKLKDSPSEDDAKFSYLWNCREDLAGVAHFIIATDADRNGQILAEELARRFGREKCSRVIWPQGRKDANEVLANDGRDALLDCLHGVEPWPISGLHGADDYRQEVFDLYDNGRARALSTGWHTLDQHMTIAPGQFSVVTGIPNHGKSEFLDALFVNMAERHGWKFAVCSFENPPAEHLSKLAEKRLAMPFWAGKTLRMTKEELSGALDWIREKFTFIRVDGEGDTPDIDWLLEKCSAAVFRYGVNGVVIDPWNEIEHKRPASMTETEYIGQSIMKLKRFAATRGVHVWMVAHPSKLYAENGKEPSAPTLYDISGSANWANKPDIGVVIHRNKAENKTEIHIRKVRFKSIGKIGMVSLDYDPVTGRYSE